MKQIKNLTILIYSLSNITHIYIAFKTQVFNEQSDSRTPCHSHSEYSTLHMLVLVIYFGITSLVVK